MLKQTIMAFMVVLMIITVASAIGAIEKGILILLQRKLKRETPHIKEFEALRKPETVEDAKQIMMRSREDDYGVAFQRALFIEFLLFFFVMVIMCVVMGILNQDVQIGTSTLPMVLLVSFLRYMPYHAYKKDSERILDGSYFLKYPTSDEELLRITTKYVEEYDAFERAMGRVPAEPGTLPEDSWKSPWLRRKQAADQAREVS